jgi:acetylglutamate kinase
MTAPLYVVKLGGEQLIDAAGLHSLLGHLAALRSQGCRLIVVHGGGPQADALAALLGHQARKVQGRRITTDRDLEIATYLYGGALNLAIIAGFARHGVSALRVCGLDGGLITARRRPPSILEGSPTGAEPIDFGHVGDVVAVEPRLLGLLLDAGYVPVISPLAGDGQGAILNINADTIASTIATALAAEHLVLVTNVPGILDASGAVIARIDRSTAQRLKAEGVLTGGMIPKVDSALAAVEQGVGAVHIVHAAGLAALQSRSGTVIVAEQRHAAPATT